jgi:hypothetical protein
VVDILDCKLYKLSVDGAIYYVPLWERINYFDACGDDGGKKTLTVICDPLLDDAIQIDDGVLYIWHTTTWGRLGEIVASGSDTLDVAQGFGVPLDLLRITSEVQEIQLKGVGVPSGSVDDIKRGDVVIYVQFV